MRLMWMVEEDDDDVEEIDSRPQALTHFSSPVMPPPPSLLSTKVQLFLLLCITV